MESHRTRTLTAEDAWSGGYLELAMYYPAESSLEPGLAALWSYHALDGPVASPADETWEQPRLDLTSLSSILAGPATVGMFGRLRLPDGAWCACMTKALRYEDGEEFISVGLPLGSLANAWPWVDRSPSAEENERLDGVLLDIAAHVFTRSPFSRGLVGFELRADEELRRPGPIPEIREVGVLDVQHGKLAWHAPWPNR